MPISLRSYSSFQPQKNQNSNHHGNIGTGVYRNLRGDRLFSGQGRDRGSRGHEKTPLIDRGGETHIRGIGK